MSHLQIKRVMGLYKGSLKLQTFGTSSFLDLIVIVWHSSAVLRIPTISTTSPLFLCSNWLIEMKLKIFCGTLKNFCFHFATFLKIKFFCPKKLKIVLLERRILRSNYCKSAQNFQLYRDFQKFLIAKYMKDNVTDLSSSSSLKISDILPRVNS